jgi:hypothetical protein
MNLLIFSLYTLTISTIAFGLGDFTRWTLNRNKITQELIENKKASYTVDPETGIVSLKIEAEYEFLRPFVK